MAFFEAFQNSNKTHNGDFANGNIVLIKDGFCWPALFFTPIWLLFSGMWLIFTIYIGLSLVFMALGTLEIISANVSFWLNIATSIIFAYEANFLRKWTLKRGNYRHIGVSLGNNIHEAEVRFFEQFADAQINLQASYYEQPVVALAKIDNDDKVVNPISTMARTEHQKSHWKVGGKRKADSVVGMFNDD